MKLDSLDKSLLKNLQTNGRLSLRDLGRALNVPHTTIFTRINKLVKQGVIDGFSAILKPHDVGFKLNMIVVDSSDNLDDKLTDELRQYSDVMNIFRSKDGKIFLKTLSPNDCTDDECLKDLKARLYGYNYTIHEVNEVVKYDHKIHDNLIDQMK
ncbi:MAG: AsnC family transcriptional regulator [Candidatus Altiarchaeota archaeon]|nr:AsnC family transcriptional regulator [Candidatus Altiarchaeota archaeon]